jgi:TusA-related sulfurtransferase
MKSLQADASIDIRDSIIPIGLLMVENRLGAMRRGQVLQVLCMDKETKGDLVRIVRNSGHLCIKVENVADHFQLLIKKGPFK